MTEHEFLCMFKYGHISFGFPRDLQLIVLFCHARKKLIKNRIACKVMSDYMYQLTSSYYCQSYIMSDKNNHKNMINIYEYMYI